MSWPPDGAYAPRRSPTKCCMSASSVNRVSAPGCQASGGRFSPAPCGSPLRLRLLTEHSVRSSSRSRPRHRQVDDDQDDSVPRTARPAQHDPRWGHWSGYLSALKYDMSPKHEYFAVRNSAGFFDTSPLYKYRITGRDAERLLAGVMTRDIRQCRPGRAQYTVWCDDRGFVLEDGVVFRHSENDFLLTAAEPNFGYLSDLVGAARRGDRGRDRRVRHAGRAGATVAADPRQARPRGGGLALLRARRRQDRQGAGDDLAHRLHRRPRLRGPRRAGRRARRARRGDPGRRGPRAPALRRGGAAHDADRGGPGPDQRRVLLQPATPTPTTTGSRPRSSGSAGCSRASTPTTVRSSVATRSAASSPTRRRAGPPWGWSSTGPTTTGSTTRPA